KSRRRCRSATERALDRRALLLEAAARSRPAGAAIPVGRVAEVTLEAMQMRVHPCRFRGGIILHERMRGIAVAARDETQGFDRGLRHRACSSRRSRLNLCIEMRSRPARNRVET